MKNLILSLLLFFSTSLQAGCWMSELSGRWSFYSVSAIGEVTFCDFSIFSNGDVKSHGECIDYLGSPEGVMDTTFLRGNLELNSDCTISGSIVFEEDNVVIRNARLSTTRNEISGIWTVVYDAGIFTATRAN